MNKEDNKITIIGAGPVGSLLSIYLSRQEMQVDVFEKRNDLRIAHKAEGRSINLALSHRGLKALFEVGLEDQIKKITIPMKGRMIHGEKGELIFQPYGEEGQFINSISRNELNKILIDQAEKSGVQFHFNHSCDKVDSENGTIDFSNKENKIRINSTTTFGADGAFSELRKSFENFPEFSFQQEYLSHGYKELYIPSSPDGKYLMEKNALHIWPREQFMLIALPNIDGSFTVTLFLPFKGENSFEAIKTESDAEGLFERYFPDALLLIPDLKESFFALPPSSLVTVHCFPWVYKDKAALIGDAAHAITPFYGQGMNAGFEDCRILNNIISENKNWGSTFSIYQKARKANGDAIAELALQNFIEMRDLVGDENFILRKKIEAEIHKKYPSYLPLYSMVTFSDIPYKDALSKGREHDKLMERVMAIKNIKEIWQTETGWMEVEKILDVYLLKQNFQKKTFDK